MAEDHHSRQTERAASAQPAGEPQPSESVDEPQSDLFPSELAARLRRETRPGTLIGVFPSEDYRLSFVDVACLIINRMIGTGIFNSPRTVIIGTRSTGGTLLLWFIGTVYAMSAIHVYIEYGLNVPRYVIDGVEQALPRSGGDLHYLSFVYRWPYYQKGTVLYSACLFGISFILAGNMAGNCVSFGIRVLLASNPGAPLNKGLVYAIATGAAFFSCIIHAVSRRGGILLNNLLAIVKAGILILIPLVTIVLVAGGIKDENGDRVPDVFQQNMHPSVAFQPPADFVPGDDPGGAALKTSTANGYAAAFLSIIWAFGGIEQSNHVLGEIKSPRRTFPRAATFAVGLVALLYMLVNISYMAVVPANLQSTDTVALLFFQRTFGRFPGDTQPDRIFNSFLALSSLGNVIVTTYTAARMKQEIAKQGFIPFYEFFSKDSDVSVGRLVLYLRSKKWPVPFFTHPQHHQEATPVGALVLHLVACLVLIWSTYGVAPDEAFNILTGMSAYLMYAVFSFFLALGILILRTYGPPPTDVARSRSDNPDRAARVASDAPVHRTWREMTGRSIRPWLSVTAAIIYLLGNAFPIIASWLPSTSQYSNSNVGWFVVPTIGWAMLAFSSAWWLGFLAFGRSRQRSQHKTLVRKVFIDVEPAEPPAGPADDFRAEKRHRDGGKVLAVEEIVFTWEGNELDDFDMDEFGGNGGPRDQFAEFERRETSQQGRNRFRGRREGRRESQLPPSISSSEDGRVSDDFADFDRQPPPRRRAGG